MDGDDRLCSLVIQAAGPAEEAVGRDKKLARGEEERNRHFRRQSIVVVEAVDRDSMTAGVSAAANQGRERRRETRKRDYDGAKGG